MSGTRPTTRYPPFTSPPLPPTPEPAKPEKLKLSKKIELAYYIINSVGVVISTIGVIFSTTLYFIEHNRHSTEMRDPKTRISESMDEATNGNRKPSGEEAAPSGGPVITEKLKNMPTNLLENLGKRRNLPEVSTGRKVLSEVGFKNSKPSTDRPALSRPLENANNANVTSTQVKEKEATENTTSTKIGTRPAVPHETEIPDNRKSDGENTQRPQPPVTAKVESPMPVRKSGGVLQGEAIQRVMPAYPPDAKRAGVQGTVIIEITIDEAGTVLTLRAISGHSFLRDAAVSAAKRWKFKPTLLSGVPVKVIGTIKFNFTL